MLQQRYRVWFVIGCGTLGPLHALTSAKAPSATRARSSYRGMLPPRLRGAPPLPISCSAIKFSPRPAHRGLRAPPPSASVARVYAAGERTDDAVLLAPPEPLTLEA